MKTSLAFVIAVIMAFALLLSVSPEQSHAQTAPSPAPPSGTSTSATSSEPLRSLDSTLSSAAQQLNTALQSAFASDTTHGSNDQTMETLMAGLKSSGFYGAGSMRFTSLGGRFATLLGGYGGWYFNKSLMVGGGWMAHTAGRTFGVLGTSLATLREDLQIEGFNYGGLVVEYTFDSDKALHYGAQILLGGGNVTALRILDRTITTPPVSLPTTTFESGQSGFVVIEPALQAEVNITRAVRASFGGSYRLVAGLRPNIGITNADLSGFSLTLCLKFGRF
jgi:hypothetical protein